MYRNFALIIFLYGCELIMFRKCPHFLSGLKHISMPIIQKFNLREMINLDMIDIDGNNFSEFPLKDGAFTCAYFSLDDKYIFFSSTMHLGENGNL